MIKDDPMKTGNLADRQAPPHHIECYILYMDQHLLRSTVRFDNFWQSQYNICRLSIMYICCMHVQLIFLHVIASTNIVNKSYHSFCLWDMERRVFRLYLFIIFHQRVLSHRPHKLPRDKIQLHTFMVFWSKAGWLNCTPRPKRHVARSAVIEGDRRHSIYPMFFFPAIFPWVFEGFFDGLFLKSLSPTVPMRSHHSANRNKVGSAWTGSSFSHLFPLEIIQYFHTFLTFPEASATLVLGGTYNEPETYIWANPHPGSSSLPPKGLQF